MKTHRRSSTWICLAIALGAMVTADTSEMPSGCDAAEDFWATYKIIVERNIFSRQRSRAEAAARTSGGREAVTAAPNPESYYVLKGVVREDDTFIAFLEDTRYSEVLRVREGDSVARGVIEKLNLDSIEFQLEGQTITVALGRDLEGRPGSSAVTMGELMEWSQASSSQVPQEAETQEQTPTGDDADILRQLMERRQQELGN